MEIAKLSSKGQITLPKEIREKLCLKEGDKVMFIEKEGEIIMLKSAENVINEMRDAMKGEAERLGLESIDDVVKMIKEIRKEKSSEKWE